MGNGWRAVVWLMRPWLLFFLLLALIALVWTRGWRPPDRYNPWAALDLRAAPDGFFRFKMKRLEQQPAQCLAALTQAGADFTPVADRDEATSECGWTHALRLRATGTARLERPAIVSCPLAASLVLLDGQVLQPTAQALFRQRVTQIDHVGSYACRRVDHRDAAPLSRHARAEAIDLTGFRLADGTTLSVIHDWSKPGREGVFMHEIHDGGCRVAGMLLGPDYNRAHRTHFHLQQGGWGYCH